MGPRANVGLRDRQLVGAFAERIAIDPDTKTGVVVIAADLETAMPAGFTREPTGDRMSRRVTRAGFAWERGLLAKS